MVEYLEVLNRIVNDNKNKKEKLCNKLSNLDLRREDILHYIEFGSYNAVEGWKLIKALKETSKERRIVKDNLQVVDSILGLVNEIKLDKTIKRLNENSKTYTYRTDIIYKTLGVNEKGIKV